MHVFHWSDPWCQACCKDTQLCSASYPFEIARTPMTYLMTLTFAILFVKATLGAKYPESICFWFSFSKNRTQSSRPSAGKEAVHQALSSLSNGHSSVCCPGSQHFLLKRPKPYRISYGEFLMSKLFWKLSSCLQRFLDN